MIRKITISAFFICAFMFPFSAISEKVKIFFDKNWEICKSENATYYRICDWDINLNYYNGKFNDFQLDKTMVAQGFYENRKKNGSFIFYHDNGAKKLEAVFNDDEPNGTWVWYFQNEQVHFKINFTKMEFDVTEIYNTSGKPILGDDYLFTYASLNYFGDNSIYIEGKLINGLKEGKWKVFMSNKNVGYDLFKKGDYVKSKYNINVPSAVNAKVINSFLFIPNSIIECEKMNLNDGITEDDYSFLNFLFPWEPIDKANGIVNGSMIFEPDQKPMYFHGIKNLYHDVGRNTRLGREAMKYCKNWGYVYYELILDEEGNVIEKNILKSPDKLLSKVQLSALEGIGKFKPAYHDGKPIKSRILLRQKYTKPTVKKSSY